MEEVEEQSPWQSLDLDDSDIVSSFSLRRCSLLSQPPSPPSEPPGFRRIPGPAAAIQAAMHRKDHYALPLNSNRNRNDNSIVNEGLIEISTQEYIRRIQDDSDEQQFTRNPWLFAIHSLRPHRATSLKDINNCVNVQRFDTVAAVVKSCTPNGLGDMTLTMKDPTATISASINRKVLTTGEFGKLITAGSILILQKVVAFPSSCESCYLNITKKNVVKVISVDCEVQYFQDTNLDNAQVIEKASERKNSTSTSRSKNIETSAYKISKEPILSDLVDSGCRAFGSSDQWRKNQGRAAQPDSEAVVAASNCEDQASNVGSAPSTSENYANQHAWQKHGPELKRMLTGKFQNRVRNPDFRSLSVSQNLIERDRCTSNDTQHGPVGPQIGVSSGPSLVDSLVNREIANPKDGKRCTQMRDNQPSGDLKQYDPENTGPGGLKKQKTGLISRTSVQEWTDEQLSVLEMDDD